MENETDEQFEERVLNKRAAQMFLSVRARLQKQDSIQLSDMTYRNNRKQVIWNLSFELMIAPRLGLIHIVCSFVSSHKFLGGSKVLFAVGVKEIPGVRNKTRFGIR